MAVYLIGTFNVLDNFLAAFLAAGFYLYFCSITNAGKNGRWLSLTSGGMFGAAFLTKGFLAFVLPIIVIIPWLLLSRRWRVAMNNITLVLIGLCVIAPPWAIAIHLQEPDFWRYFIWEEHLRRFAGERPQHEQPFYYYLMFLPGLAFPWLAFAPAAVTGLRLRRGFMQKDYDVLYLSLWIVAPFIFFSYASGKLTTYILPCFAPAAVLLALGLRNYAEKSARAWVTFGAVLNGALFFALLLALFVWQLSPEPLFTGDEITKVLLLGAAFMIGAVVCGLILVVKKGSCWVSCLSILPLMVIGPYAIPDAFLNNKAPGVLLQPYAANVPKSALVVSDSGLIRSVSWYWKRDDVLLIAPGELAYGLSYKDSTSRLLTPDSFQELVRVEKNARDILLVCKRQCPEQFVKALQADASHHRLGRFVIWHLHHNSP